MREGILNAYTRPLGWSAAIQAFFWLIPTLRAQSNDGWAAFMTPNSGTVEKYRYLDIPM